MQRPSIPRWLRGVWPRGEVLGVDVSHPRPLLNHYFLQKSSRKLAWIAWRRFVGRGYCGCCGFLLRFWLPSSRLPAALTSSDDVWNFISCSLWPRPSLEHHLSLDVDLCQILFMIPEESLSSTFVMFVKLSCSSCGDVTFEVFLERVFGNIHVHDSLNSPAAMVNTHLPACLASLVLKITYLSRVLVQLLFFKAFR